MFSCSAGGHFNTSSAMPAMQGNSTKRPCTNSYKIQKFDDELEAVWKLLKFESITISHRKQRKSHSIVPGTHTSPIRALWGCQRCIHTAWKHWPRAEHQHPKLLAKRHLSVGTSLDCLGERNLCKKQRKLTKRKSSRRQPSCTGTPTITWESQTERPPAKEWNSIRLKFRRDKERNRLVFRSSCRSLF